MTSQPLFSQPSNEYKDDYGDLVDDAVRHALDGKWHDAADLNRQCIAIRPNDVEAHNRLAKALIETGRYADARGIVENALRLSPANRIANRHMERLGQLDGRVPRLSSVPQRQRAAGFIADASRTTVAEVEQPAADSVMAVVSPGNVLKLEHSGARLAVLAQSGERIGLLELRLSQRLARLIDGGNEYEVTLAKAGQAGIAVMIVETKRAPALAGTPSFPPHMQNTLADFDLDDYASYDPDSAGGPFAGALAEPVEDEEETPAPDLDARVRHVVNGDLLAGLDLQDDEYR